VEEEIFWIYTKSLLSWRLGEASNFPGDVLTIFIERGLIKAPFGLEVLKFNSHHINVPSNAWSTKCRLIICMSVQIRSNLRDEFIKPN
jgi:hypothetical protein